MSITKISDWTPVETRNWKPVTFTVNLIQISLKERKSLLLIFIKTVFSNSSLDIPMFYRCMDTFLMKLVFTSSWNLLVMEKCINSWSANQMVDFLNQSIHFKIKQNSKFSMESNCVSFKDGQLHGPVSWCFDVLPRTESNPPRY